MAQVKTQTEKDVERLSKVVRKEADDREYAAGAGGQSHDGGAQHLRDIINAWCCGRLNLIPKTLQPFVDEIKKQDSDPEYVEYLRLKEKYDG